MYDLVAITHYGDGTRRESRLASRLTRRGAERAERRLTWSRALPLIAAYNEMSVEGNQISRVETEIRRR
jgi:hypothetical protein